MGWTYWTARKVPCRYPGTYWVYRRAVVNKYLCGFHARRYIHLNLAEVLKGRVLGKAMPRVYLIEPIDWNWITEEQKKKLEVSNSNDGQDISSAEYRRRKALKPK